MKAFTNSKFSTLTLLFLPIIALTFFCPEGSAAQLVVQSLCTSATSGAPSPFSELVEGPDGNFYGTVAGRYPTSYGSVFRLARAGVLTNLVTFNGINGGRNPAGGLCLAKDGYFYGTTSASAHGSGTLFKVSVAGAFQTLHAFGGADGAGPSYTLVQASDGYLYGVTTSSSGGGATIFKASTNGIVTTLTNWPSTAEYPAPSPNGGLVEGPDGWLYGTVSVNGSAGMVVGSIIKIGTNGVLQTLVNYYGTGSPWYNNYDLRPMWGLTPGRDGYLYGTIAHPLTLVPLALSNGSAFRMSTNGVMTTLIAFDRTNGSNPTARMLLGKDGAFYGYTSNIFRLTTNGICTPLAPEFTPYPGPSGRSTLTLGNDENIYGTAVISSGGTYNSMAFRVVEPPLLSVAQLPTGSMSLSWNSFTNGTYQILYKTDLAQSNWDALGPPLTATGTSATYEDVSAVQALQRF